MRHEVAQDLAARFLYNCPQDAHSSWERFFFQVEEAHWYYMDFMRTREPDLPALGWKQFVRVMFETCPELRSHHDNVDELMARFSKYKSSVPTFGCALLNETRDAIVLVRGTSKQAGYGFPKGKVNRGENAKACAAREAREETGFDPTHLITDDSLTIGGSNLKLFVAYDVPEDTVFETQTRGEIGDVRWFRLDDIPTSKTTARSDVKFTSIVGPFLKKLKRLMAEDQTPSTPVDVDEVEDEGCCVGDLAVTFGDGAGTTWSAEEMFRVNQEQFGVTTNYSFDFYTTKLPPRGKCLDENHKGKGRGKNARKNKATVPKTTVPKTTVHKAIKHQHEVKHQEEVAPLNDESLACEWRQFRFDVASVLAALDHSLPSTGVDKLSAPVHQPFNLPSSVHNNNVSVACVA